MSFQIIAQRGNKGPKVKQIQEQLNIWALTAGVRIGKNKPTLVPDSDFGGLTEAAVKLYQRSQGLLEDGVVGPFTWAMLLYKSFVVKVPFDPKIVAQSNSHKCWAAATEYWLKTRAAENQTQAEITANLRTLGSYIRINALSKSGGLTIPAGTKLWEHHFKIRPIAEFCSKFFIEHLATRLQRCGRPLMMGRINYNPETGRLEIGHIVCPIAVQAGPIGKGGAHMLGITVMDPMFTNNFVTLDLAYLRTPDSAKKSTIMMTWVDYSVIGSG